MRNGRKRLCSPVELGHLHIKGPAQLRAVASEFSLISPRETAAWEPPGAPKTLTFS